jgi:hypothetical protein
MAFFSAASRLPHMPLMEALLSANSSVYSRATQHRLKQYQSSMVVGGIGTTSRSQSRFFGSQPIATLQDPKHLLKTFRNNLFFGARLLTFPNSVALFSQVHKMSQANDSPIFQRDVEKLDRQDDNAATRLFST